MRTRRMTLAGLLLPFSIALSGVAFGQTSITGEWRKLEEAQVVIGLAILGDFTGLPIRPEARQAGDAWDESTWSMLKRNCSPYGLGGAGGFRAVAPFRAWVERDPNTQAVVAIRTFVSTAAQERTIWMDGRPHPSKNAPHSWQGFSTGSWSGNMLTVTTTHLKQFWHRRNGIRSSDNMTVKEQFIRHGKYLTWIMITEDPQYLTEPLIYSENFELVTLPDSAWQTHLNCQAEQEVAGRSVDWVPHIMWDTARGREYATEWGIPFEATRGGAETMYPEYIEKMKALLGTGAPPTTSVR